MAQVLKTVCAAYQRVFFMRLCQAQVIQRTGLEFRIPVVFSPAARYLSDKRKPPDAENNKEGEKPRIAGAAAERFKIFQDEDSPVILDMHEEKQLRIDEGTADASGWSKRLPRKSRWQTERGVSESFEHASFDVSTTRGKDSVFEIEELVKILQLENAVDLCVISVPPVLNYADFIVIVTGRSLRHICAMAEYVRKLYKTKRGPHDRIPKIEGEESSDWKALDFGNIILHIFTDSTRKRFDLETLWAAGAQYDDLANKEEDPVDALFHEYSLSLQDFKFNNEMENSEDSMSVKKQ